MLLGGLPFVLFVRCLKGDTQSLTQDSQVRTFIGFLLILWVAFTIWLFFTSDYTLLEALTLVAFNTTSTSQPPATL